MPLILIFALLATLLSACGSTASAASNKGPVNVTVTLSEFAFQSSLTDFKVGVPYHFTIINKGAIPHELMIVKPLDNSSNMTMEEMDNMALADVEADDLPAGGTATLDYTFTAPATPGTLEFACHIPGHYESGMKLPITVTQ